MLPNEAQQHETAVRELHQHLQLVDHALQLGISLHDQFIKLPFPPEEPRVRSVLGGVIAQLIFRLRASAVLCERAFPNESEILVRSLFETRLAARFIIAPRIDPDWSTKLPKSFPSIPAGRCPVGFRADLYAFAETVRLDSLSKELTGDPFLNDPANAATIQSATGHMPEVRTFLGPEWTDRLIRNRGRSYSGMSVAELAKYCGHAEYYKKCYGHQSSKVHGADALSTYLGGEGLGTMRSHAGRLRSGVRLAETQKGDSAFRRALAEAHRYQGQETVLIESKKFP